MSCAQIVRPLGVGSLGRCYTFPMETLLNHFQLLEGVVVKEIQELETHILINSFIPGNTYNHVVVKNEEWLNEGRLKEFSDKSFYLLNQTPSSKLQTLKLLFVDQFWIAPRIVVSDQMVVGLSFREVDEESVETYVKLSEEIFPDWPGAGEFAKLLCEKRFNPSSNRLIGNYLMKLDEQVIGMCSFIYDPDRHIGYLTNAGVLPEFRRRGAYAESVEFRAGQLKQLGAIQTYAIAAPAATSGKVLAKLGFEKGEQFSCYFVN